MNELNIADIFERVSQNHINRPCIIQADQKVTYGELEIKSRCLANHLASNGLGLHTERSLLQDWESGQDHIGLLMYNCPEYIISEIAMARARTAGININYRYVDDELLYLFRDAGLKGLVFHSSFAPTISRVLKKYCDLKYLIQVKDDSGTPLLNGATWFSDAIKHNIDSSSAIRSDPDDLHILYTGGTTGMPKGVLWRQADLIMVGLGGRRAGKENNIDNFLYAAERSAGSTMPVGPFMHASGRWTAIGQLLIGNTVVMPTNTRNFDAADVLETLEQHKVSGINITGDAMARPLIDQLSRKAYDLSSLRVIVSGAAVLSKECKSSLVASLPHIEILDMMGSSETGPQATGSTKSGNANQPTDFQPDTGTTILDKSKSRVLPKDNFSMGWLARSGRLPLGYYGDEERTRKTFFCLEGTRYAIPGDRARWDKSGKINLIGREAATINSGGEKIFSEEVEIALKHHHAVRDTIVCGRPSKRWGQEVVAVVELQENTIVTDEELLAECSKHIARYKLPKHIIRKDKVKRSPSGKPDFAWAKSVTSKL